MPKRKIISASLITQSRLQVQLVVNKYVIWSYGLTSGAMSDLSQKGMVPPYHQLKYGTVLSSRGFGFMVQYGLFDLSLPYAVARHAQTLGFRPARRSPVLNGYVRALPGLTQKMCFFINNIYFNLWIKYYYLFYFENNFFYYFYCHCLGFRLKIKAWARKNRTGCRAAMNRSSCSL